MTRVVFRVTQRGNGHFANDGRDRWHIRTVLLDFFNEHPNISTKLLGVEKCRIRNTHILSGLLILYILLFSEGGRGDPNAWGRGMRFIFYTPQYPAAPSRTIKLEKKYRLRYLRVSNYQTMALYQIVEKALLLVTICQQNWTFFSSSSPRPLIRHQYLSNVSIVVVLNMLIYQCKNRPLQIMLFFLTIMLMLNARLSH